jgi:hypothetical protein
MTGVPEGVALFSLQAPNEKVSAARISAVAVSLKNFFTSSSGRYHYLRQIILPQFQVCPS